MTRTHWAHGLRLLDWGHLAHADTIHVMIHDCDWKTLESLLMKIGYTILTKGINL